MLQNRPNRIKYILRCCECLWFQSPTSGPKHLSLILETFDTKNNISVNFSNKAPFERGHICGLTHVWFMSPRFCDLSIEVCGRGSCRCPNRACCGGWLGCMPEVHTSPEIRESTETGPAAPWQLGFVPWHPTQCPAGAEPSPYLDPPPPQIEPCMHEQFKPT